MKFSLEKALGLIWYDQSGSELHSETRTLSPYAQEHLIVSAILSAGVSGSLIIDGTSPAFLGKKPGVPDGTPVLREL